MSTSIPGRGKTRKNGQDLNTNSIGMGGGQMAMPPNVNGATFCTPSVHQASHAPQMQGFVEQTSESNHPKLYVPNGYTASVVAPSTFVMNLPRGGQTNMPDPSMQWNPAMANQSHMPPMQQQMQARPYPQQQPYYAQNNGYNQMPQHQMAYMQPQQMQFAPQQQDPSMYAGGYMQQQPQGYPYRAPPHMQQQSQMMMGQQQAQQHMQMQQQHQAPPMQQMQHGQLPQQQQQQQQQQQPQQGAVPTGAPMTNGPSGAVPTSGMGVMPNVPVSAPMYQQMGPMGNQGMPQQQARPTPAPVTKRKVLAIVNPDTQETINEKAIEAVKNNESEEPAKQEDDEAKGTDEMDSAAPEVKSQFAEQMLTQLSKPEQSAPAPAPKQVEEKKGNKCLFSLDQLEVLHLKDKVPHAASAPKVSVSPNTTLAAPAAAAPAAAAPVAAPAPAAVAAPEKPAVVAPATEYLPERLEKPAYPENYKEKQEKQSSPDTTQEMPAMNDNQLDVTHVPAEVTPEDQPASSSSEKNTSNDSAICVQTPNTSPQEKEKLEKEKSPVAAAAAVPAAPAAEVAEKKEKTPVVEEPVVVAQPKQLEKLVIEENLAEESEQSEPSTPAPVTPSASESVLVEEEEAAEKAAAAAEEARQQKRAELEDAVATHEQDPEQCDSEAMRYNREYLYAVRDFEKLFLATPCPLKPEQLINFGICRSLVKEDTRKRQDGAGGGFMPAWHKGGGGGGGGGRKQPYGGRQSEQHHRGGGGGAGGGGRGPNKKMPAQFRPSIERRVESNVQLHKADNAWKPEKTPEDIESDEAQKKLLSKNVRSLFNKITPTTKDALIDDFLKFKVSTTPFLDDVISIIFDKAVEEPKFCPIYSNLCSVQVSAELKENNNISPFRNAILRRAQETFSTKTQDDFINEKQKEIEAEEDERKKKEKQIELLEAQNKFRRRKFGNITFIGQLYLQSLLSIRIIQFCLHDLLKSTIKPPSGEAPEIDEESLDCACRLLETIGKRLWEEALRANTEAARAQNVKGGARAPPPPMTTAYDVAFQCLEGAMSGVSSRIKFMIMNLVELKKNNWTPRKTADAGPKKLDEIKKDIEKEARENSVAQAQYDRKSSRQEGGMVGRNSMGMPGSGNQKRGPIARNSIERGTIEDRRTQAAKSVSLASRGSTAKPKASLSSVTTDSRPSLGGARSKWSGGASGGSENSKKEDRASAIQSAARIARSSSAASNKAEEEKNPSGSTTQANSEDEREQNEAREKQEAEIEKRLVGSVNDYASGEIKLDESRDEIFATTGEEKYGKPSLETVFKCLMGASLKKAKNPEDVVSYGHVLSYCLLKKAEEKDTKGREEMLRGIAAFCRRVIEVEMWEDMPRIWDFVAEVIINAHLPAEGLFEGAHPTLNDFKDAFLTAAQDARKPYALFVTVLKRLAEMHYKRDKEAAMEIASWVLAECEEITKKMDTVKLDKALMATEMSFSENLHKIMRQ